MGLRISESFRIGRHLRVGASIGTNGRPRIWLTERIGRVRVTESTSIGRRRRKR